MEWIKPNFQYNRSYVREEASSENVDERLELDGLLGNMSISHAIEVGYPVAIPIQNNEDMDQMTSLWNSIRVKAQEAFWDTLKADLERDPMRSEKALTLLKEVREKLFLVMTPNVVGLKESTKKTIDLDRIETEIDEGIFDLHYYSSFILSVIKQICAPSRDGIIKKLMKNNDIYLVFKGIINLLDKMKLDLVNYTLNTNKPDTLAKEMEYERYKFTEFVDRYDLKITKSWLLRQKGEKLNDVLSNAFLELLKWNHESYPETLVLDVPRLRILKCDYLKVLFTSGIGIACISCLPAELSFIDSRKQIIYLIYSFLSGLNERKGFSIIIPSLIQELKRESNRILREKDRPTISQVEIGCLMDQIERLVEVDNRVMNDLEKSLDNYLKEAMSDESVKLPVSLMLVKDEVELLSKCFCEIVSHNKLICLFHYRQILNM